MERGRLILILAVAALAWGENAIPPGEEDEAALLERAFEAKEAGAYTQAVQLHRWALARQEAAVPPDLGAIARNLANLAALERVLGRLKQAETLARRALELGIAEPCADDAGLAVSHHVLAVILFDERRYYDAEPHLREALRLWEQAGDAGGESVAIAMNTMGLLHLALEDPEGAERNFRRALALQIEHGRGQAQATAALLANLATSLLAQGRLEDATEACERSLALWRGRAGVNDTLHASTLQIYSKVLRVQNRKQDSQAMERQARLMLDRAQAAAGK